MSLGHMLIFTFSQLFLIVLLLMISQHRVFISQIFLFRFALCCCCDVVCRVTVLMLCAVCICKVLFSFHAEQKTHKLLSRIMGNLVWICKSFVASKLKNYVCSHLHINTLSNTALLSPL